MIFAFKNDDFCHRSSSSSSDDEPTEEEKVYWKKAVRFSIVLFTVFRLFPADLGLFSLFCTVFSTVFHCFPMLSTVRFRLMWVYFDEQDEILAEFSLSKVRISINILSKMMNCAFKMFFFYVQNDGFCMKNDEYPPSPPSK